LGDVEFMRRLCLISLVMACIGALQLHAACARSYGPTGAPDADEQDVLTKKRPPTASTNQIKQLDFPGQRDTSLWYRYYQAGEDALTKNDRDRAKAYLMAALGEIEKHPPDGKKDMFLAVKVSALQVYLTDMYPKDWSTHLSDKDKELDLRKEQVQTLYRVAQMNARLAPPGDLLISKSRERYETARTQYEKLVKSYGEKDQAGAATTAAN
jgi:hypothetical protein